MTIVKRMSKWRQKLQAKCHQSDECNSSQGKIKENGKYSANGVRGLDMFGGDYVEMMSDGGWGK